MENLPDNQTIQSGKVDFERRKRSQMQVDFVHPQLK